MTISKDLLTKILSIFCIIASVVAITFSVVACCLIKDDSERVYVESIALNEDGDLVVTYTDETTATIKLDDEDVKDGEDGKSAYDLYVETVPEGETPMTVEEWLESLKGEDGKDGAAGTNGNDGKSAYEIYVASVPEGEEPMSETEWLASLKGEDGVTPVVTINEDGYWVINGEATDVKAEGQDGENGTDGVGIAYIYLNEKNEITIVLTDRTVYSFPVSSVVEEQTPPVTEPSGDEETEGDVA